MPLPYPPLALADGCPWPGAAGCRPREALFTRRLARQLRQGRERKVIHRASVVAWVGLKVWPWFNTNGTILGYLRVGAQPILVYFSWDWDVRWWSYGSATGGRLAHGAKWIHWIQMRRCKPSIWRLGPKPRHQEEVGQPRMDDTALR